MRESLKGMRVVRAYNAESYQEEKFDTANTELTDLNLFISRNMSLMLPMMTLVSSGLSLGVYWIGAYLISEANLPDKITIFSDMIVFSSYAMQVVIGFMMMTMIFVIMPRTMVSAKRINEVLDSQASLSYPEALDSREDSLTTSHGHLVFDHVSFTYPGASKPALENVSFQANQGQTIAFIGSTGSGKSTLVNLLPRLYDVTEGQIIVNGRSVKDYPREVLNNLIGYIPQTAILFNGTIDSNLDFGQSLASPLSQADMWKALDLAQGKDFVEAKENQLDSHVAQGGGEFLRWSEATTGYCPRLGS